MKQVCKYVYHYIYASICRFKFGWIAFKRKTRDSSYPRFSSKNCRKRNGIVTKMYNDVQRIFMQVHILKNVIKEVITGGEFFYLLNIFQRAVGYFIYFFMCSFPVIVDFKIPYKCTKIRALMASCVTCNFIQIIFSSTESFYSFYCPNKCYNFSNRVFTLSNHIFIFLSFSFNNFVMQRYILH